MSYPDSQLLTWAILPVGQNDARFAWCNCTKPGKEIGHTCVSAKSTERVDLRLNGNLLTVDAHEFGAFHQTAPQRFTTLISDDENMSVLFPEILFEMMEDSSGIAHASACHDKARPG